MKGLELAEAYFKECGLPLIRRYPEYAERIAAGMAGPGSECFGFDDDISRDHDWGPGFCLWLTEEDFAVIGPKLARDYNALPKEFMGFGPRKASPGEEYRVGPDRIDTFYLRLTGRKYPPRTSEDWAGMQESNLALAVNGKVFYDPAGDFTARRNALLEYYPEPVRLKKTAYRLFLAGQAGQYNIWRAEERGATFQAKWAEMQFSTETLRILFLLNRRFAPFDKWLLRAAGELPVLGPEISGKVEKLIAGGENKEFRIRLVNEICDALIGELRKQGISTIDSGFLLDHSDHIRMKLQGTSEGGKS